MVKRTRRKQSADRRQQLTNNIACGLHRAARNLSLNDIRKNLVEYDDIDADQLRRNFIAFGEEVAPYAERLSSDRAGSRYWSQPITTVGHPISCFNVCRYRFRGSIGELP